MTINRSAILQQLQAYLTVALTGQAEVSLLAKEPLNPLASQPQVLIKLLSEQSLANNQREAHEQRPILQSANHKYRALHLGLTITAMATDAVSLLTLVDNIANRIEKTLLDTEQVLLWQNLHLHKSEFVITEQGEQFLLEMNQSLSIYCINKPPEQPPCPEITEVYLGQQNSDYHLVSSLAVKNLTSQKNIVHEAAVQGQKV